jgi:transcription elongation factor Elf1
MVCSTLPFTTVAATGVLIDRAHIQGKRKSSSKPQAPKKREPLATTFTCLFCNHEKSVTVKVDKKAGVGILNCAVCAQSFQCGANYLSAPIDIYSEWVDAAGEIPTILNGRLVLGTFALTCIQMPSPRTRPPAGREHRLPRDRDLQQTDTMTTMMIDDTRARAS